MTVQHLTTSFPRGVGITLAVFSSPSNFPNKGRLFKGIDEGAYVYFVHSYYLKAEDRSIVTATTDYSVTVDASVESGNVFACQFHPEKSADVGMQILKNFLEV